MDCLYQVYLIENNTFALIAKRKLIDLIYLTP